MATVDKQIISSIIEGDRATGTGRQVQAGWGRSVVGGGSQARSRKEMAPAQRKEVRM